MNNNNPDGSYLESFLKVLEGNCSETFDHNGQLIRKPKGKENPQPTEVGKFLSIELLQKSHSLQRLAANIFNEIFYFFCIDDTIYLNEVGRHFIFP